MAFKTNWSPLSGFPGRKAAPLSSLRVHGALLMAWMLVRRLGSPMRQKEQTTHEGSAMTIRQDMPCGKTGHSALDSQNGSWFRPSGQHPLKAGACHADTKQKRRRRSENTLRDARWSCVWPLIDSHGDNQRAKQQHFKRIVARQNRSKSVPNIPPHHTQKPDTTQFGGKDVDSTAVC